MAALSYRQIVGRALRSIDGASRDSVTVRDLCAATGVCERTLRNAFHEVHGVSPKQYLLRAALEQAHEALQQAGGERGKVTQVATDCGFFELGRFAGAYRMVFGELPSETLRASAMM